MGSRGLDKKPIVGYSDPLSVEAGQSIKFMISTASPEFSAQVVKLRHGDPAPGGPGLRYEAVTRAAAGVYPGREQPLQLGSYVEISNTVELDLPRGFTLEAWVYPTVERAHLQGIITRWNEDQQEGYGLFIEPGGATSLRINDQLCSCDRPLRPFAWTFVAASWDVETSVIAVRQIPLGHVPNDPSADRVIANHLHASGHRSTAPMLIGGHAIGGQAVGRFNGKIDSPRVYARPLADSEISSHASVSGSGEDPQLVVALDFASDTDADVVTDTSGHGNHGRTINHPTRGVTGHNWRGSETCFARAPAEYNCAYFHEDDLDDARWEPDVTVVADESWPSGIYALRVETEEAHDWIPFFVRPPAGTSTAQVAFLAPTLSYLAYANDHSAADTLGAVAQFDISLYHQPEDEYAITVPVCGLYDHHPDGSGFCYSSWRRPIVNMRPHYHLPVARSAHQLAADLHLIDWLEEQDTGYDVVTDHDLHHEREALLKPYRVVITGTHPEYWSEAMLDSLESYLAGGGRLMYMGGNGFYWVTSVSPSRPHLIEVRRGRRGTGSWRSAPGEDYHSTTGELGGLWRDRGRAPQRIAGIGMAAQGFDEGQSYRREPASYQEGAWIFDGVEEDEISVDGLVLGEAAGFEMDRLDHRLGTPPNALHLATARGFSDSYQHVVEEVSTSDSLQSGTKSPYVRADMVYFERDNGSAVFSPGSISWCGALSHNGYDNPVSRITANVLKRFAGEDL